MGFFNRNRSQGKQGTTKDFFIGNPEAEGEDGHKDFSYIDFFEDFMGITDEISNGKFIIMGRKGAGKSAYAKYLHDQAEKSIDFFTSLLKDSDIDFEAVIQLLPAELPNKYNILFEWLILTKFIKLIIGTRRAEWSDNIQALEKFYQLNSGVMQIDKLALQEIKDERALSLNLGVLADVLKTVFGKKSLSTYTHAPFYSFIPTLKEIIVDTLKYQALENIDFVVMFDDLDVNFNLKSNDDQRKLMSLLRVARDYNTTLLKDTDAKVLIFLRNDIAKRLEGIASDKTKILGTYGYTINWYDHSDARKDENNVLLRKFINKRISANFKKFGYAVNSDDAWSSFVAENQAAYGRKSSFKYLLDFTFYRPRDLLNIFKNIGSHEYVLPLNANDVISLLRVYAEANLGEITDEISVLYDKQQIKSIKGLLGDVSRSERCVNYTRLKDLVLSHSLHPDVIQTLIDYSLIVPYDSDLKKYYYSYREDNMADNLEKFVFTTAKSITLYYNPDKVLSRPKKYSR